MYTDVSFLQKGGRMSGDEKGPSLWGFAGKTAVSQAPASAPAQESAPDAKHGDEPAVSSEAKNSAQYDIVQIAPVERFNCVFKSGQKIRLTCWVMLRHKTSGEMIITGAVSSPGASGRLTLAIDFQDVDKFAPM